LQNCRSLLHRFGILVHMEIKPKTQIPVVDPRLAADFPKYLCTSIADQIKQADVKAFGTLSIIGITTAGIFSRLSALKSAAGGVNEKWLVFFAVSAFLVVLALKASITVVYPRLTKSNKQDKTYFMDIAHHTKEEFLMWGKNITTENVIEESYKNAYNLAQIAKKKYLALRKSMLFTLIALIWALAVLLFS